MLVEDPTEHATHVTLGEAHVDEAARRGVAMRLPLAKANRARHVLLAEDFFGVEEVVLATKDAQLVCVARAATEGDRVTVIHLEETALLTAVAARVDVRALLA